MASAYIKQIQNIADAYRESGQPWPASSRSRTTTDRGFMIIASQQRRQQIVGDCRQLKTDVNSFNENNNTGDPIKMVFDFTYDVEEAEG